jgi:hypothetical protein
MKFGMKIGKQAQDADVLAYRVSFLIVAFLGGLGALAVRRFHLETR